MSKFPISYRKAWRYVRLLCSFSVYFILFLIVSNSFFSPIANAGEQLHLRVGAYDNPPKIAIDSNGNVSGFWPDLLAYIAARENWDIEYIPGTWNEALENLSSGNIDIMVDVGFTPERANLYAFSEFPVLMSWSRVYERIAAGKILSILDLNDKKIGGLRGSVNIEGPDGLREMVRSFALETTIVEFASYHEVFEAIEAGLIDAGISNRDFGDKHAGDYPVERTPIIFQPINMQFAFPKEGELTPHLITTIDRNLNILKKEDNSIYFRLLNQYFEGGISHHYMEIVPAWFRYFLLIVSGVAIIFLAVIVISRFQVNRKTRELSDKNRELRESEKKFRAITSAAPDAIIMIGNEGEIVFWNKAAGKIFGYSDQEVLGKEMHSLLAPQQYHEAFKKGFGHFRVSGEGAVIGEALELSALRKNGEAFPIELSISAIKLKDKWHSIGIIRDITERKKAEEKLMQSEERFRNLVESTSDWVWEVDENARYTYVSPKSKDLLGYEPEELLGKTPFDIMQPEEAKRVAAIFGPIAAAQQPIVSLANTNLHKDGWQIILETCGVPFFDLAGKLKGYRGIDRDITKHRKLENQLRHALKMEAVGTLAGGVAHDFNNILNIIIGYGTMVLDRLGDDDLSREQINEVLAAADRAATLTRRLLAFSRKQVVDLKPVNVNEIILGLEKMLARIIGEDIVFTVELADREMFVMADSGQIEQVLMNLVSNARDAMPKGGRLTISSGIKEIDAAYVTAYGYGKIGMYALISVADTGSGMDAETQKNIFEPFFTTKGVGEGTGLGLAITYGIIKQHDGYIKVYSEKGMGTTFKILLPLIEEGIAKGKGVEAAAPVKGGTETILIAEDDGAVRQLTRIILESFGYRVITAEDGEDAIIKYGENRDKIQLVVLDMIMPKKNGKEAYAAISRISPDIKTLFVSGYTMDIIHKKELFAEGVDFILKPVSPQDLLKKVREILDR